MGNSSFHDASGHTLTESWHSTHVTNGGPRKPLAQYPLREPGASLPSIVPWPLARVIHARERAYCSENVASLLRLVLNSARHLFVPPCSQDKAGISVPYFIRWRLYLPLK